MSTKFDQIKNLLIERRESSLGTSRRNLQKGCGGDTLAARVVVVFASGLDWLSAELIDMFLEKLIAEGILSRRSMQCLSSAAVKRTIHDAIDQVVSKHSQDSRMKYMCADGYIHGRFGVDEIRYCEDWRTGEDRGDDRDVIKIEIRKE
jgi:hypothetical protein